MNPFSPASPLGARLLEEARRINAPSFIADDPVQFPRMCASQADAEICALLVSTISWGRRTMICRNGRRLLELMNHAPHRFMMERAYEALDDRLNIHRTFFAANLKNYLRGLRLIYNAYPTLDAFAAARGVAGAELPSYRLAELIGAAVAEANDGCADSRCLPLNLRTTALKRLNMALRWLVRDDGIVDLGLWRSISPRQLLIPLDVHSAATARSLGMIRRAATDRKALMELMDAARQICPDDPALLDYALFGIGMGL